MPGGWEDLAWSGYRGSATASDNIFTPSTLSCCYDSFERGGSRAALYKYSLSTFVFMFESRIAAVIQLRSLCPRSYSDNFRKFSFDVFRGRKVSSPPWEVSNEMFQMKCFKWNVPSQGEGGSPLSPWPEARSWFAEREVLTLSQHPLKDLPSFINRLGVNQLI